MAPLPPFKLERYFARWEFDVPHMLCASDVETHGMTELLALADDEARDLWERLALGYTESTGHPRLRDEIATLYDGIAPQQTLVFAGAEEAIFCFAHAALRPGDHAIVVWPAYQALYEVARSVGADVTLLPLRAEERWRLDLDALCRAVRPNTRAIVVNYPHNPTGAHITATELRQLVQIAREAGAWLFSDEVYRFSEYDPADRLPGVASLYERGVSLGVLSKAFGLAGLRIGWVATQDEALLARLMALKDYTTICAAGPSEILALIALRARETILARNVSLVKNNVAAVERFMAAHEEWFEWLPPRAGCIAFPRLKRGGPVNAFCDWLAREHGVLLMPGDVFDHPHDHFRIGFGRASLPPALPHLERALATRRD
ncbi:MAG TPA: aminotransferase class I/II-fold pyridoxal phosphate-dependent enzyme [Chloroflexota bacterium]|nr:aminotransferase class I/II-fold pyridoxal phosphate-dependent enzyme [Chloroflexota bacterium]